MANAASFHVYHVVAELERKGEIDPADFNANCTLAERLVKRVRPALITLLITNPQLTEERIKRQVERLVDRHLDDCLDFGPSAA